MDTWTHTHVTHQLRRAAVLFPKQTGTATWHVRAIVGKAIVRAAM